MNREQKVTIGNRAITAYSPVYIIAEAGVNHNGDLGLAKELVLAAKEAGADCVKFQTFKAEKLVTQKAPKASYQLETTSPAESQMTMLKKLELQTPDYIELIDLCKKVNIQFLSTPYNNEDALFLHDLGVDAFKVASGQCVELPFLKYLARLQRPIILSTGMTYLAEVEQAVRTIRNEGNDQIIVLQCTTNYPSRVEDANLLSMKTMEQSLQVLVGYSDHTQSEIAPLGSIALGARVFEKHFTLDKNMEGPDHSSSADPKEFRELVLQMRQLEAALGTGLKVPCEMEARNIQGMRRSLVSNVAIAKGQKIEASMLGFKRPATGLHPNVYEDLLGKTAACDIPADVPLQLGMIQW